MTPRDPISENMAFLKGEPTKAFIYQDHDAHIATHTTFMQDPMIMQTMGQNPAAQQMMGAVMAHIAEHLGYQYRRKIEEQLGVPLPPPNEKMPEEVEVQLSQLVAQASVQLLQQHMSQAQQQKNQQTSQDPLIQMQQAELQIKAQEAQTRAQKTQADIQLAQEKLKLEAQRMMLDMQKETQRVGSQERQNNQKLMVQDRQNTQKVKADLAKAIVKPQGGGNR
jgi:hypothetical protein